MGLGRPKKGDPAPAVPDSKQLEALIARQTALVNKLEALRQQQQFQANMAIFSRRFKLAMLVIIAWLVGFVCALAFIQPTCYTQ